MDRSVSRGVGGDCSVGTGEGNGFVSEEGKEERERGLRKWEGIHNAYTDEDMR